MEAIAETDEQMETTLQSLLSLDPNILHMSSHYILITWKPVLCTALSPFPELVSLKFAPDDYHLPLIFIIAFDRYILGAYS